MIALVSHTPVSLPSPLFLSYLWCRVFVFFLIVAVHLTMSPRTVEETFMLKEGIDGCLMAGKSAAYGVVQY